MMDMTSDMPTGEKYRRSIPSKNEKSELFGFEKNNRNIILLYAIGIIATEVFPSCQ